MVMNSKTRSSIVVNRVIVMMVVITMAELNRHSVSMNS